MGERERGWEREREGGRDRGRDRGREGERGRRDLPSSSVILMVAVSAGPTLTPLPDTSSNLAWKFSSTSCISSLTIVIGNMMTVAPTGKLTVLTSNAT